jgi:hypothetical protein
MEELEHRQNKNRISNFVQALLTAVASIFLAFLLPAIPEIIRNVGRSRQTGLTAAVARLLEGALSLWFWLMFLISFSWFYTASRSDKGPLRIALFWIPAVGISVLGLGFWIGVTLLLSRVRMQ